MNTLVGLVYNIIDYKELGSLFGSDYKVDLTEDVEEANSLILMNSPGIVLVDFIKGGVETSNFIMKALDLTSEKTRIVVLGERRLTTSVLLSKLSRLELLYKPMDMTVLVLRIKNLFRGVSNEDLSGLDQDHQ